MINEGVVTPSFIVKLIQISFLQSFPFLCRLDGLLKKRHFFRL